jgi:hypothetical protein
MMIFTPSWPRENEKKMRYVRRHQVGFKVDAYQFGDYAIDMIYSDTVADNLKRSTSNRTVFSLKSISIVSWHQLEGTSTSKCQ